MASVDKEFQKDGINVLESLSKKHLYISEKVNWYTLPDDGLPRFETMPKEIKYLIL
jgi:hypothetical protein